jgi:ParB-like chromosome segregation protein Spo0J
MYKDRIVELRRVRAGDLAPAPLNWRKHPKAQQDAMKGILDEIGYADAVLARETPRGLELIDGHLRTSLDDEQVIPVLILDLNDEEAKKMLLTLDPLAAMAETDADALAALLADVTFSDEAITEMLESLVPEGLDGYMPPSPPEDFQEFDENINTDHSCPKCGYVWSGGE